MCQKVLVSTPFAVDLFNTHFCRVRTEASPAADFFVTAKAALCRKTDSLGGAIWDRAYEGWAMV